MIHLATSAHDSFSVSTAALQLAMYLHFYSWNAFCPAAVLVVQLHIDISLTLGLEHLTVSIALIEVVFWLAFLVGVVFAKLACLDRAPKEPAR